MKSLTFLIFFVLSGFAAFAQQQQQQDYYRETNPASLNSQDKPLSVVKIISGNFDENRNFHKSQTGSGVIVDSRGLVVTSRSIVFAKGTSREFPEIWAGVSDGRRNALRSNQAYRLRLVAHDEGLDIALLKIETRNPNQTFAAIPFGETGTLRYGQELKAVGFMQAAGTTLSMADTSFLDFDDDEDLLKVEGQFLKGVAGSAIIDRRGRLIGIPTRIAAASQTVPFFNQDNEEIGRISLEEVGLVVPVEAIQEFMRSVPNLVSFTIPGDLRKNVTLEGAITDKRTNQPIQRATVGILLPNSNSRQYIEADELVAYARTDARGSFRLNRRIKPGTYSVKVVHPDYRVEYKTIQIPTASGRLIFEMSRE